jgi:hypothetical protein
MTSVAHLKGEELMRVSTTESTSRYLSMALASRRLMNHLDIFSLTGEMDEPTTSALRNLLSIIDAGGQTGNSFAPVPGTSPFGRYEQTLVVNEVAQPFNLKDVRGKLGHIIDGTVPAGERPTAVRDVNEFLYDLENRALHEYSEMSSQREW